MPAAVQILIFTRYPVSGKTKTRLIPALDPSTAAQLHRRMTEHVLDVARCVRKTSQADSPEISIAYTGAAKKCFRAWLGPGLRYVSQGRGDLGARMKSAFAATFGKGAKSVLAIGTDIPELSHQILSQAIEGLQSHDVLLGPAGDGGYYLIGMKRFQPDLFTAIDWGSRYVLQQTKDVAKRGGLAVMELKPLNDVDRPEDLTALRNDARFIDVFTSKPIISAVIPTLNESNTLKSTLQRVCRADAIEIIIADGGSTDSTLEIASEFDVKTTKVSGGRAHQLNAGAAASNGRLLFFLHADTIVPAKYDRMIRQALENPVTVAGAFRFRADSSSAAMKLIEWGANIRSSIFHWPYGDQGLFMGKRVFMEEGGFAPMPIMEDFDLIRRLRRRGRIVTLRSAAVTSARRWLRLGPARTWMVNQIMIAGFYGKIPIPLLERFYRGGSKNRPQNNAE